MPTNYTKNTVYSLTTLTSVPAPTTGTGTIETVAKVINGTGTLFLTELPVGSFVLSLAAGELRKVVKVENNTTAFLDYAFSVDIPAASALKLIHENKTHIAEISAMAATGAGAFDINGVVWPEGVEYKASKANRERMSGVDFVDPIIVDGSGSTVNVSLIY